MTVVAVVGGTGAPGATTTSLGLSLAWPLPTSRRVVMVEADPSGGAVLSGALGGRVTAEWGLHQLGLAQRQGQLLDYFFRQLIDLSDGDQERLVLPGLAAPDQAPSLTHAWEPLASLLAALDHGEIPHDVVVDLGRDGALGGSSVLARRADVVLVVVRSTLRSISAARTRVAALRRVLDEHGLGADALGLAVIAEGPYPASEVSAALGAPVLAVLPYDVKAAQVLSDGCGDADKRFMRGPWMSAVRSAADEILVHARTRRVRLAAPRNPGAQHEEGAARVG
ncbi:hypothetical protein [Streptomyces sp. SID3343]|uniref:hypothetical protein n=1 Tax=Streptomyces sp. SID3343 TaxID=2690260 RepID=UPI00136E0185|nr:hypothetical protein [Streptomyces sp. SID3343]MYV97632.1 hypothetical protein [Streptomyces sp. SID3343]